MHHCWWIIVTPLSSWFQILVPAVVILKFWTSEEIWDPKVSRNGYSLFFLFKEGILMIEHLSKVQKVNAEYFCNLLCWLKDELKKKLWGKMFTFCRTMWLLTKHWMFCRIWGLSAQIVHPGHQILLHLTICCFPTLKSVCKEGNFLMIRKC